MRLVRLLFYWLALCRLHRLCKTPFYPWPHLSIGLPRGISYLLLVPPLLSLLFVPHDLGFPLHGRVTSSSRHAFPNLSVDIVQSVGDRCAPRKWHLRIKISTSVLMKHEIKCSWSSLYYESIDRRTVEKPTVRLY